MAALLGSFRLWWYRAYCKEECTAVGCSARYAPDQAPSPQSDRSSVASTMSQAVNVGREFDQVISWFVCLFAVSTIGTIHDREEGRESV